MTDKELWPEYLDGEVEVLKMLSDDHGFAVADLTELHETDDNGDTLVVGISTAYFDGTDGDEVDIAFTKPELLEIITALTNVYTSLEN